MSRLPRHVHYRYILRAELSLNISIFTEKIPVRELKQEQAHLASTPVPSRGSSHSGGRAPSEHNRSGRRVVRLLETGDRFVRAAKQIPKFQRQPIVHGRLRAQFRLRSVSCCAAEI